MTKAEAKAILQAMTQGGRQNIFNEEILYSTSGYVSSHLERKAFILDGEFSLDELEAIVMWVKDPKGVFNA